MLPIFAASFVLFAMAAAGIGIGAMITGKRLKGSCGGIASNGQALGDCLCARKKDDERRRALGGDENLLAMAEFGRPGCPSKSSPL